MRSRPSSSALHITQHTTQSRRQAITRGGGPVPAPMANIPHPDNIVSLATQHVGVGHGGTIPMLARVTIVDFRGDIMYDFYVAPTTLVTDYRTAATGITSQHLLGPGAVPFDRAQTIVSEAIGNRIVVGHSLWNAFSVLGISHLTWGTRDYLLPKRGPVVLGLYMPMRIARKTPNTSYGLPSLVWFFLHRKMRLGLDDSVENARAGMDLYRSLQREWEGYLTKADWPCALPPAQFKRCFL